MSSGAGPLPLRLSSIEQHGFLCPHHPPPHAIPPPRAAPWHDASRSSTQPSSASPSASPQPSSHSRHTREHPSPSAERRMRRNLRSMDTTDETRRGPTAATTIVQDSMQHTKPSPATSPIKRQARSRRLVPATVHLPRHILVALQRSPELDVHRRFG